MIDKDKLWKKAEAIGKRMGDNRDPDWPGDLECGSMTHGPPGWTYHIYDYLRMREAVRRFESTETDDE